ncbi:LAMI_0B00848g1_1 [Lachancea mirantina]|uniref:LAMI_0B00848g1_1 n=1 Tax=Lachancea mirantina TaxID=1230905 RepID=A0A1G4ITB6_9SACH|nr:LAMI_0B00848g1_1 [Lachancea mirantina]
MSASLSHCKRTTEDSDLIFQFSTPLGPAWASEAASSYPDSQTSTVIALDDAVSDAASTAASQAPSYIQAQAQAQAQAQPRTNDATRLALAQTRVLSHYNNYLNGTFGDAAQRTALRPDERRRIEEMVDAIWLNRGPLTEDLFEDSSDEDAE